MTTRPAAVVLQSTATHSTIETRDPETRVISGLAVPYGPVGHSSMGPVTFASGSITWTQPGRVKLLEQHDPERPLGFATDLTDAPDGLRASFQVGDGPDGDRALMMAADGRRDGLSVGVRLSAESVDALWTKAMEGDDSPTAVTGELVEVSQVTIPAFADARTDGSVAAAGGELLTLAVDFTGFTTPTNTPSGDTMSDPVTPVTEPAVVTAASAPAPALLAGNALNSIDEAPVYTFDGRGPSFVRDVYNARFNYDNAAMDRINRFHGMLSAGAPKQGGLLTAAVETTSTAANYFSSDSYRADFLVSAIDKGRPLVSSIGTYPLTDATPFRIPVDGSFSGVADHTEGQSHATEGDLTIGDVTITPVAVSGALRLSRELIDASNPAIDQVALRAMARDYRSVTEGKVAAALLAADGTADLNIDTVLEVRASLNSFYDVANEPASFIATSTSFYGTMIADVDSSGRPHLAYNPANNVGQAGAGYTGASIDGVPFVKSSDIAANDAFIVNAADVFLGESALQTFRFDEVEGPGIVKLALWAYFAAKVTRATSVVQITSAAA